MNKLKEIRKLRGLTQYELGRAIGRSQAFIWQVEHGYHHPRIWDKRALAEVLRVQVSDIFSETS